MNHEPPMRSRKEVQKAIDGYKQEKSDLAKEIKRYQAEGKDASNLLRYNAELSGKILVLQWVLMQNF